MIRFSLFYRLPGTVHVRWRWRILIYSLVLILSGASYLAVTTTKTAAAQVEQGYQASLQNYQHLTETIAHYQALKEQVTTYQAQGVDSSTITAAYAQISIYLSQAQYDKADALISEEKVALETLLATKKAQEQAAQEKLGTLAGVVTDSAGPLNNCAITLSLAGQVVATGTTDQAGNYSFTVDAGTYSLNYQLAGYTSVTQEGIITAQQTLKHDVVLSKVPAATPKPPTSPTPTPTPKPTAIPVASSDSTPYSSYQRTSIKASSGTFTADIMTFDLASGHIRVMEDTAADGDCATDCPVKSVMNFVKQDGGFAGINGTYFCPTAYGDSCAGKTNSFYWKQWNSRLQKMINPDNTLGEQDPFIVFDPSGHATFLRHWVDYKTAGLNMYAGISCLPAVVLDGQYAVNESTLDDKQRTSKISRAALGLKGQTLYVVIIQGATVQDLGHAMEALGVDNAMNIDAGGSSGMVYKNSYRRGPGRDVPNALVFVEQ